MPEGYCDLNVYCILHAPAQVDEQVNIHTEKKLRVEGEKGEMKGSGSIEPNKNKKIKRNLIVPL